jgi:ribokinase
MQKIIGINMKKSVVLGSINMDLVVNSDRYPSEGETIIGNKFDYSNGGKGANQAVAIAKQGGDVSFIGKIGDDEFGNKLLNNLLRNNVKVDYLKKDADVSSGVAVILVEKDGQNRIVVVSGANAKVSSDDVVDAEALLDDCSYLIMQLEIPIKTIEFAVRLAKEKAIKTVLNASPLPVASLGEDMLKAIDYLVVNEIEAEGLTGIPVVDIDSGFGAAKALHEKTKGTILLTLGKDGSIAADNGDIWHTPSFGVDTIDSTGAGDAFIGGFIGCLQRGSTMRDAVIHASATGSLSTCYAGVESSMPTYEDTVNFIKTYHRS